MEAVVERENMNKAYEQVRRNGGKPGTDKMSVLELPAYFKEHWPRIKEELLNGTYRPQPVLGVQIPKPNGGTRQLGIPTVLDRVIQQAIHQVLNPIYDPEFSPSSYGFRKGRSTHQAVLQAREYVKEGRRWVIDIDLEKFFDRVNHDILMSRLARRIKDKRLLRIIRKYLQSGIMMDGVISPRVEGTPQGSPLSPLLSNILLDELDKELEKRGHRFCRYADDCNIYVGSKKAGERVLERITEFLRKQLQLKVNQEKSGVNRPWKSRYLGYSMTIDRAPKLKPSSKNVQRFKKGIRELTRVGKGWNMDLLIKKLTLKIRGWGNYFKLAEVKKVFEELDSWIRRRLRRNIWKQWKKPKIRRRQLMNLGISEHMARKTAYNGSGPWANSRSKAMNIAIPKKFFDAHGLASLLDMRLSR